MGRRKGSKNKPKDGITKTTATTTTDNPATTTPSSNNHITSSSLSGSYGYNNYDDDFDTLPSAASTLKATLSNANANKDDMLNLPSMSTRRPYSTSSPSSSLTSNTIRQNPRMRPHPPHVSRQPNGISDHSHNYFQQPEPSIQDLKQEHEQLMRESMLKLKQGWEEICAKYGQNFDDEADEIDLQTGQIIVDNGHLRGLKDDTQGNYDMDNWLVNTDSDDDGALPLGEAMARADDSFNEVGAGQSDGHDIIADDEALEVDEDEDEEEHGQVDGAVISSLKRVEEVLGNKAHSPASPQILSFTTEHKQKITIIESPTTPDSMTMEHDGMDRHLKPLEEIVPKPQIMAAPVLNISIAQSSFRSPEISPVESGALSKTTNMSISAQEEEKEKDDESNCLPTTPPAEAAEVVTDIDKEMDLTPPPSEGAQVEGTSTPKKKESSLPLEEDSAQPVSEESAKKSDTESAEDVAGGVSENAANDSAEDSVETSAMEIVEKAVGSDAKLPGNASTDSPDHSDTETLSEQTVLENETSAPEIEESDVPITLITATATAIAAVSLGKSKPSAAKKQSLVASELPQNNSSPSQAPPQVLKGKEKAAQESPYDDIWKIQPDDPFYDPKWDDPHPDGEPPSYMFPPPPKPYVSVPYTPSPRSTPRRKSRSSLPSSRRKSSSSHKSRAPPPIQIATPRSGMYMEFMKARMSEMDASRDMSGKADSPSSRKSASIFDDSDNEDDLSFLFESTPKTEKGTKRKRQSLIPGDYEASNESGLITPHPPSSSVETDVRTPKSVKLTKAPKCGTPGYRCQKTFCFTCIED